MRPPCAPCAGGGSVQLGALGDTEWYRCRACGATHDGADAEWERDMGSENCEEYGNADA